MTASFEGNRERITVFEIDGTYLFKQYFERTDLFEHLKAYYNPEGYRFEIPADEFEAVESRLADEYYELAVVDDPAEYCVVKEKYTTHADILTDCLIHWERRDHLFFLMTDAAAVERAVDRGATRIEDTDFVLGI